MTGSKRGGFMNSPETDEPELTGGAFVGRETFRARVRSALLVGARQGWREIVLSDASFFDWPLGDRSLVEALTAWAHVGHRLTMLAQRYDEVERQHPLFVVWRRQWAHKIECRRVASADPMDLPSALWAPAWSVQRFDILRSSGISGGERERLVALREQIDGWLERSTAGFPATTLGL